MKMVPNSIYCRKFTIHFPLRILNVTLKMKQEQRILKTNESRLHHLKKNTKMEREKNNNNNYLMFWKLVIKLLKMTKRMLWNTGYNILENTILIFVEKKSNCTFSMKGKWQSCIWESHITANARTAPNMLSE